MDLATCKAEVDPITQQQIERLLESVTAQAEPGTGRPAEAIAGKSPAKELHSHDFRAPSFLAAGPLRQLRQEHEDWAQSLALRLSNYLRLDLDLRVKSLEARSCRDFLQAVIEPKHFATFKIAPWRGVCACGIDPHLALSFVDRLMGGTTRPLSDAHELSEIDTALLDQVLDLVLGHWCQHWARLSDLRPEILGHENGARYLQLAPDDCLLLVLVLEARSEDSQEEISLVFPCSSLEPLFKTLSPTPRDLEKEPEPAKQAPKWNPALAGVDVGLVAEWPARQVSARQVTGLSVGDVLEWDMTAAAQVKIRLSQNPKFVGRLGTRQGRWAVEITGKCPARTA